MRRRHLLAACTFGLVFAAAAIVINWEVAKLGNSMQRAGGVLKLQELVILMSNMVVLPQIILGFAMLDIFVYDIYGSHIMPIWLFALIIMVLGGIVWLYYSPGILCAHAAPGSRLLLTTRSSVLAANE